MIKGKKGVTLPGTPSRMFELAFFAVALSLFAVILVYTTVDSQHTKILPQGDLENIILRQRFLNNPDCFIYTENEIQRPYPGKIDLEKFTQERLNNCYSVGAESTIGCFKFRLIDLATGDDLGELETINWQTCSLKLKKGFVEKTKPSYMLYLKDGKLKGARLDISSFAKEK